MTQRRMRPAALIVLTLVCSLGLEPVAGAAAAYRFAPPQPQDESPPPTSPAPKKSNKAANPALEPKESFPTSKADQKKGKEAYKRGLAAESAGDGQRAFDAYSDAVDWDANVTEYGLHQAIAKGHVVQLKLDAAEKAAVAGDLTTALRSLREALELDPTNRILAERLAQMEGLRPGNNVRTQPLADLAAAVQLDHLAGTQSFQIRGQTEGAYQQIAQKFGVEVAFDVDLRQVPVHFDAQDMDFVTVMRIIGEATGTFWRPLTKHLFFVAQDTAQKRKDYQVSIARTVLLPASITNEQMTELVRLIREVTGITRTDLDERSRTITMRASPQAMAVATGIIDDLEKPPPELVLEIEVLELDKDRERNLGIVGPQNAQLYSIPSDVGRELTDGTTSIATVITQIFGGTSIPAFLAFGGGLTTYLYTLPNVALTASNFLSTVRAGRKMLLRAEDGHPATFFLGERYPVSLAQYSSSLGTGSATATPSGAAGSALGISYLGTGTNPDYVATADLNGDGFPDVIVANFTDGTLSIFLGAGDGTFDLPTTVAVGAGPVWVATGDLHKATTTDPTTYVDILVANQNANTLTLLLGNGDGTFQSPQTIKTGTMPTSIAIADFNDDGLSDFAVVNQGDNTVGVYLQNTDGTFTTPTTIAAGSKPTSVVAAALDSNSNALIDLAVTNSADNTVQVYLGNGKGGFTSNATYATGVTPLFVASADVNADEILDLIVVDSGTEASGTNGVINSVSVFLGNGDGTFGTSTALRHDYPAGLNPTSLVIADFNADGIPDMAVTAKGDNALAVLIGLGTGLFAAPVELPLEDSPVSAATADFNSDGLPDVAVTNYGSNTVAIVLDSESLFGGLSGEQGTQFPNAEYIDIGLKVKATPRVHPNDEVTLQMEFTLSSLANQSFNNIPVVNNQEIHQTMRLTLDQPTVVAGYTSPQHTTSINGEPGLSEIPVAGADADRQFQYTQLVIVITPRMISFSPHKDHVIYAGRGQLEGSGALGPTIQERRGEGQLVRPAEPPPQQPQEPVAAPPQQERAPQGAAPAQAPAAGQEPPAQPTPPPQSPPD